MRDDFEAKLATFIEGCERIYTAHMERHFPNNQRDTFEHTTGKKFVRVVRKDGYHGGGSVHCFVDIETGDVLKAASWAKPAKHARGNIFDDHNGLANMNEYGPAYLR